MMSVSYDLLIAADKVTPLIFTFHEPVRETVQGVDGFVCKVHGSYLDHTSSAFGETSIEALYNAVLFARHYAENLQERFRSEGGGAAP